MKHDYFEMTDGGALACRCGLVYDSWVALAAHCEEENPAGGPAADGEGVTELIEETRDFDASDALRMAVDLNTSRQLVLDEARALRRQTVLEDAEAFYQWLKGK